MYDLVIKHGLIVDGTNTSGYYADIGIKNERIIKIGDISAHHTRYVIDATDNIITPGFIDIHTHSDFTILVNSNSESKIRQGITTEVIGNCGISAAPRYGAASIKGKKICNEYGLSCNWNTVEEYLQRLEQTGIGVNIVPLVGHGNIRASVIGYDNITPDTTQMNKMKDILAEALSHGCFGMSSGLIYPPGCFANTEELITLCRIVAEFNGIYATHIRSEGSRLIEAIEEALTIKHNSNVWLHISHLKTAGPENWSKLIDVFNRLDHQTGISADRYPYTASSTELDSILPVWVYDGGVEKELERLKQPQICDKIIKELADQYPKDYWERIVILSVKTEKNKCWIGKRLSELMNNDIKPLIKLLIDEECMVDVLFFSMSEDNLQQILKKSYVVIGSDASSRATYGILAQSNVHPRAFGTFPRILKRYVKELQVLRLEEAIAKMTAMPAKILGITNRGIIQEDMFADIVIFDMNEICDTADYNSPLQYPTGIKYVILNGKVVLKNGVHSGIQSGKVLRRKS